MRVSSAALFALVGFVTAVLIDWERGAPPALILGRGLLALLLFGGLGYGLGRVGETIVREILEKKAARTAPSSTPAPPAGPAPPPAPGPEEARR